MANAATGSVYTTGQLLNEIRGKNVRVAPVMFKQFKHLAYLGFDVKALFGKGGLSLKMKELPGIEPSITVDGVSVKWNDETRFDFSTTIADATVTLTGGVGTATVGDSSGFQVNDRITIVPGASIASGARYDAIITAIPSSTSITVKVVGVDAVPYSSGNMTTSGHNIERLFWVRNDSEEITRESGKGTYTEYKSYVQKFGTRLIFTKAEINKEYRLEDDSEGKSAKNAAAAAAQVRFEYAIAQLLQEMNKAFYKARNVAPGAGANDKMEMLGLEAVCQQVSGINDLSLSTDKVNALMDIFEKAAQSGAILGDEPLMLIANGKMLSALSRLNVDKVRYEKMVDQLDYSVPTISTAFGTVEFVHDPMLNRLYANKSVGFVLPRSLFKFWIRENDSFAPQGGVTKADQSIAIREAVTNIHDKRVFDVYFEMGTIFAGMSASPAPYAMIIGL